MHNYLRRMIAPTILATALTVASVGVQASEKTDIQELAKMLRQQQQTIQALQAKLDALVSRNEMARTASMPASNSNKIVQSRDNKLNLTVKGHVNRAIMVSGDGDQTNVFHVDNDTEPTLINFTATVAATSDLIIGAQFEAQLASNPSNGVSQSTENSSTGSTSFSERHLEVFFDSKTFGKLSLGQGNTASEGTSETDLSGTNVVVRSNFGTFGAGILFRNSTTNALSAVSVGSAFDNFDGLSRDDRIRYDTPSFGGFKVSGSWLQGGATDIALRYSAGFGGAKFAASVALADTGGTSTTIDETYNGSASVLLRNGLNFTIAGGVRDFKANGSSDSDFFYGKLGYQFSPFRVGKTAFSIGYASQDDLAATGDDATFFEFGATQKLDKWGTELYAGYRRYDLDRSGASFDDISVGMVGAMVTF